MTKAKKTFLIVACLVAVCAVVVVLRIAAYTPAAGGELPSSPGMLGYPWRGAIHVHSSVSDGASGIDEIMSAAAEADVDFLILSDHNPLGPQQRPRPGWRDDVLLIVAEEITTEEGHLLALQVRPHRYRFGPTARQARADIHDEGGWALVAHPDHARQAWAGGWGGTQGLEVANLSSAWSRSTVLSGIATAGSALIDQDYAAVELLRGGWPALSLWDSLTESTARPVMVPRPRVAVGSADAHGPLLGSLPSYADTLGVLQTLVWIDVPVGAATAMAAEGVESKLLAALRAGHAAVETTALGDGRSFAFTARSPSSFAVQGDLVGWEDGPWTLRVDFESSVDTEIVVLRNGRRFARAAAASMESDLDEPGTYRVEIYRGVGEESTPPWIVSNPIYIWPAEARAGARLFRAPPLPAPLATDDLLVGAVFEANDRGVPFNTVESRSGEVSWSFALEALSDPDAFAAMIWRPGETMDWSDDDGLIIDLQARQTMRLNLEVHTRSADGQLEIWAHSIKAKLDSRPVAIPWSRFRSLRSEDRLVVAADDTKHASAADMRRVDGVVVLVTPRLFARGSRATLSLRALGLYGSR